MDLQKLLRESIEDGNMSRGERRDLRAHIRENAVPADRIKAARALARNLAKERLHDPRDAEIVEWLYEAFKALDVVDDDDEEEIEVYFSPGESCRQAILNQLGKAQRTIDICVFTITDNELSSAIRSAHRRGVAVRILTDNDKSEDRGSDVDQLEADGIPVVKDNTTNHMHHKFAIFDKKRVLTGSYNWTRSAATSNEENIVVLDNPQVVRSFGVEFNDLWEQYGE